MEAQVVETNGNNLLPQKRGFSGFLKEIFGQILTTTFWKEIVKNVAQQMFFSAMEALGGTLHWYGKNKKNNQVAGPVTSQIPAQSSDVSNRAFGNTSSIYTSSGYTAAGSYPVQSRSDVGFPGFGNRQ